ERPTPSGVVTGMADVLAGDPDRVAIDCSRTVVAPPGANRVREPLLLVAGEAVVRGCTLSAGDGVPVTDTGARVDPRVGGARVLRVAGCSERHDTAPTGRDPDCRIGEVVAGRSEVARRDEPARVRVHDV